jgi:hypothetical protein
MQMGLTKANTITHNFKIVFDWPNCGTEKHLQSVGIYLDTGMLTGTSKTRGQVLALMGKRLYFNNQEMQMID